MSRGIRTTLAELMSQLKDGIAKMNDIINQNIDSIATKLYNLAGLVSSDKKDQNDLKAEIKVNDLVVRSLGDELETLSIRILSLQAPVSRDLRRVISSFRMIYDLQRISRDAYNAFSDILDADPKYFHQYEEQVINIQDVLVQTKQLLVNFLEVYQLPISEDVDKFESLINTSIELDTVIDQAFLLNTNIVIEKTSNGTLLPLSGYYLLASFRSLERVGDHCCNLIERAIYIQSGEKVVIK